VSLHLLKLCVGCETVDELRAWRAAREGPDQPWILRTRQTPRLAERLLDGGSLYRVFKGAILCRQPILAVDGVGEGPERRCEITLDATIVLTEPTPRRAFQGWRYLEPKDAPADLEMDDAGHVVPPELARRLREAGAW
jgi:hypothetical protein